MLNIFISVINYSVDIKIKIQLICRLTKDRDVALISIFTLQELLQFWACLEIYQLQQNSKENPQERGKCHLFLILQSSTHCLSLNNNDGRRYIKHVQFCSILYVTLNMYNSVRYIKHLQFCTIMYVTINMYNSIRFCTLH